MSKNKFWNIIIICIILSVALENFKIANVLGTSLKPIHIVVILSIIYSLFFEKIKPTNLLLACFFLILPLIPLYRINDKLEFFKTYVVYFLMVMFCAFSLNPLKDRFVLDKVKYLNILIAVISIVQILGILQFLTLNLMGFDFMQNIFGTFTFHPTMNGTYNSRFLRAYSVYHEPSVLGWVTNTGFLITLLGKKRWFSQRKYYFLILLSFLSIAVTLSTSALLFFILIFVCNYFIMPHTKEKLFLPILFLGIFLILIALGFFDPLLRIFTEVGVENTSGNERFNDPLNYMIRTFSYFPLFGRGLGQEGEVDPIGIIGRVQTCNNSVFGLFVNFGLSGLIILFFILIYSLKFVKKDKRSFLVVLNMLGIYSSTGAYLAMDTFIFLIISALIFNTTINKYKYKYY